MLTTEQKKRRWETLEALGYKAHYRSYPETYSRQKECLGLLNPAWGPAWLKKTEARIKALKKKMLIREGRNAIHFSVCWGPEKQDTYTVEDLVLKGREALEVHDNSLTVREGKEIQTWDPLVYTSSDCESGQGSIYTSDSDLDKVLARVRFLESEDAPSVNDNWDSDWYDFDPLPEWGSRPGYLLYDKGEVDGRALNLPGEAKAAPTRVELLAEVAAALSSASMQVVGEIHRQLLSTRDD